MKELCAKRSNDLAGHSSSGQPDSSCIGCWTSSHALLKQHEWYCGRWLQQRYYATAVLPCSLYAVCSPASCKGQLDLNCLRGYFCVYSNPGGHPGQQCWPGAQPIICGRP
jgi:hypothetical protein